MGIVLPYRDEFAKFNEGAFITYKGEFLPVKGNHELFAKWYCNNNLDAYQSKLYNAWLNIFKNKNVQFSDFLVFVLYFDKVENIIPNMITTTTKEPHQRFFNYYLMDWQIETKNHLRYNVSKGIFEPDTNILIEQEEDREAQYEIEEIKSQTLKRERNLFFK